MILRLEMPQVDRTVPGGVVLQWHFDIGDEVTVGAPLVDVLVDEVVRLRREFDPNIASRRRWRRKSTAETHKRPAGYTVRVTSRDRGVLRSVVKVAGERVEVGEMLAVVTSSPGETIDDPEAGSLLRVTTYVVEEEARR